MKKLKSLYLVAFVLLVTGCQQKMQKQDLREEDMASKRLLQGVWIDDETQEVNFKINGDTIFYPDSTSQPARFMVMEDTLVVGEPPSKYPVVKLSDNVFIFKNQNGEELKLVKSYSPDDTLAFAKTVVEVVNKVVKKDTVVAYQGERYHCYVAINPTKYKVFRRIFNDDGVAVDNVYYDNIIHLSLYHGADKLFSSDIKKQMYSHYVPEEFLSQSILGDINFSHIDGGGFHFDAIIGIPEGTTSYVLDTEISMEGKLRISELK